jgi:protein-S-isoprenylcysteine O-methyltransferase
VIFGSPAGLTAGLFGLSEIVLAFVRRAHGEGATTRDRGSVAALWLTNCAAIAAAIALAGWAPGRLRLTPAVRETIAIALMGGGLLLRWVSIVTLGRFFTVNVATHHGHQVVDHGPYRYVRHPSYTGLLVIFLGMGVFFGSWLSIVVLMIPITIALLARIRIEEEALVGALGADYEAYRARTKRLIPGLL